jgi:subtilisin family serine protease
MLSTTASPAVVTVTWQGTTVKAYQNQYVANTNNPALLTSLANKEGFTDMTSLGSTFYEFTSTLPIAKLQRLAKLDVRTFVALDPNEVQSIASTQPDDQYYGEQWGMTNTGQLEPYDYNLDGVVTPYNYENTPPTTITYPSPPYPNENKYGTVGDDIDTQQAWDITTGSSQVVVAVLDSGIDTTHPDLIPNLWVNPLDTAANNYNGDGYPGDINGYNFVSNNADVTDDNGHGTNVAGIIGAAGDNGIGVTGVDWSVKLLPVKVVDAAGQGSDASIIAGINYVTNLKNHGINIVAMNESLGGEAFPIDIITSDAIKQAGKAGVLDVVAAGNSSLNLDKSVVTPAKFSLSTSNVITVAAVDDQFQLAAFSDFGATSVDLAAPGINIFSTSPTYEVTLNSEVALEPDIPQFTEDYGYLSGTSQATPSVTGIIALEAAANPTASPAELKAALLDGVTYDPALASQNGLPALVATSGVANAYKAVLNILNYSTGTDKVRQGAWQNFYGTQGSYVVGESTSFPSVANATLDGGSPVVVDNTSFNLAATQRITDPTSRIAAYEASATSESINLSFSDGAAHNVELYLADLDNKHRVETVNLYDGNTGLLLNSQTISNFSKGEYLLYNLRGPVNIDIIRDSGPSAVYSGLFFDTAPTKPATFQGTDTTTKGYNWRAQYGSQGALVVGDTAQYPSYLTNLSVTGETGAILRKSTTAANSLQKVSSVSSGIEAYYYAASSMDINLSTDDGLVHTLTLYVADYNNQKRSERIQLIDPTTQDVLASDDVSHFQAGEFVTFNFTGNVDIRVIQTAGKNAVFSGIFFDAPFGENAHFVTTDTTTGGNWVKSNYGLTDAYVVGDNFPGADVADNNEITVTGGTRKVIGVPTGDPAALYKTEPANANIRVASYLYTNSSMTIDFNPGDLNFHQVALYFADYENYHRVESVTLYNGNTNTVLSHQIISNFRKGKYLVFDVTGPVLIVINSGSYPNAVLSGLFVN